MVSGKHPSLANLLLQIQEQEPEGKCLGKDSKEPAGIWVQMYKPVRSQQYLTVTAIRWALGLVLCAVGLNPGSSASDTASHNVPGRAVEDGLSGWAPAIHGRSFWYLALVWPSFNCCTFWGIN